jgi:hypothetical protein
MRNKKRRSRNGWGGKVYAVSVLEITMKENSKICTKKDK